MLLAALLGCAVHTTRSGLVEPTDGPVNLRTYEGRVYRLQLDEDSAPVRYLDNVVVKVEGARLFRTLWVQDWYVQDAGDGSGGFVGRLRTYGARLVVDDRNTKRTLVIADGTARELVAHVGQDVLLLGHVVGGETIEVVAFRVLAPDPGGAE